MSTIETSVQRESKLDQLHELLKELVYQKHEPALRELTEHQTVILRALGVGMCTKEIAHLCNMSPKTVEYHRQRLYRKTNTSNQSQLIAFAVMSGVAPLIDI